jgi:F-type H+-transporting ATPase subunit b
MEITPLAVVYQAILFIALYFALKSIVFDRFLGNIDARHRRTLGALEESAKLREQAERLVADYDLEMSKIRREAAALGEQIRRQGEEAERDLIETVRREAGETLASARSRIAQEAEAAKRALEAEIGALSDRVLETLLKRPR